MKKGGPRYVAEQLGLVRTVFEPFAWQSANLERFRAVPDTPDEITERRPRQIFLNVGTNDLAAEILPKEILENYTRIVARIQTDSPQSPQTEIVIASVLPINLEIRKDVRLAKKQQHIPIVNEGLRRLAEGKGIVFIDLHPAFADERDNLRRELTSGDGLHRNDRGNELYARSLARFVRSSAAEALARRPARDLRSHAALETQEARHGAGEI